ncbi:MAG TPA: hypothetical protein PLO67_15255 [Saprospiraceae bacterium]|nr:hypothetical protein [Saprospiraceae bacterium]HPI07567.1 hypothetical protein [Saprospiraceae bacterium]
MKKMYQNGCHRLLSFRFAILLAGMLLLANRSYAQAPGTEPQAQSYAWKSAPEAIALLKSQVEMLNQQIPGITEGTPLYDNTIRRVAYFKAIIQELARGATVAESLELSLPAAATLGFSKEATYTSKIVLRALKEEARVTLTN